MLPFTREQFFGVFATYHEAVWPAPLMGYVLGLAAVLALRRAAPAARTVAGALALMWLWTGLAYHGVHFSRINPAAWVFAGLFVLQAALFVEAGVLRGRLGFSRRGGWRGALGWGLIGYSALAYPLLGLAAGHHYPGMPMFGITPCPVTLFTWGVLLLAHPLPPRRLLLIPALWSLVGGSAALLLAVPQDWPLLASTVLVPALWRRSSARLIAPA